MALVLPACSGLVGTACAQVKPEEYQVKAVYLLNFGRFVEWPAPPAPPNVPVGLSAGTSEKPVAKDDSFTICIIGRDPFGSVLDRTLAAENINNNKVIIRRIPNTRDLSPCKILFVASSEAARTKEILTAAEKLPVLTVSDQPNFTGSGGMIQFLLKDNKVRFEVNLAVAEKAGLNFSSQLLKVAVDIRRSPLDPVKP